MSDHSDASELYDGFVVRPAQAADAASLGELETAARAALVDARGGAALLAEQPPVGDWAALLTDPDQRVWVAEIDGVAVGYLQLRVDHSIATGIVCQVYVDEAARELGFGDELLAQAIDATRAAGAGTIESFALPGDRDTKNLFERASVTARKLIVSKRLD